MITKNEITGLTKLALSNRADSVLHNVRIEVGESRVNIVATNGHSLYKVTYGTDDSSTFGINIPADKLKALNTLKAPTLEICASGVVFNGTQIAAKNDTFPAWQAVIPKQEGMPRWHVAHCSPAYVIDAAKFLGIIPEKMVWLLTSYAHNYADAVKMPCIYETERYLALIMPVRHQPLVYIENGVEV